MRGINVVSDQFLAVKNSVAKAPDGNTILSILGPFLFEAVNLDDQAGAYDRGKAQAFVTMARIFYAKSRTTEFHPTYLACFYRGIEFCLKRNNYMMSVVLNNSFNFFQNEFKGSKMVVPSYLAAI